MRCLTRYRNYRKSYSGQRFRISEIWIIYKMKFKTCKKLNSRTLKISRCWQNHLIVILNTNNKRRSRITSLLKDVQGIQMGEEDMSIRCSNQGKTTNLLRLNSINRMRRKACTSRSMSLLKIRGGVTVVVLKSRVRSF